VNCLYDFLNVGYYWDFLVRNLPREWLIYHFLSWFLNFKHDFLMPILLHHSLCYHLNYYSILWLWFEFPFLSLSLIMLALLLMFAHQGTYFWAFAKILGVYHCQRPNNTQLPYYSAQSAHLQAKHFQAHSTFNLQLSES
jgi:hypothetical protein